MHFGTFVRGAATGAAIAYFFDPVSGRGRRTRLRDMAVSRGRRAIGDVERRGRYVANVAQGRLTEMVSPGPDNRTPDDATLTARIQSEVFGQADIPKDRLTLDVVDGVATLRGELDSQVQIDDVVRRVHQVPGVRDVDVLVHLPGRTAANKEAAVRASRAAGDGGSR
jgi:osmotically-inducible protein OsmY